MSSPPSEKPPTSAERAAEEYAESCDNESGSFLSRDLRKIRKKGFLAGAEWKAGQVAEAVALARLMALREAKRNPEILDAMIDSADAEYSALLKKEGKK